jgi:hypothetical protein
MAASVGGLFILERRRDLPDDAQPQRPSKGGLAKRNPPFTTKRRLVTPSANPPYALCIVIHPLRSKERK